MLLESGGRPFQRDEVMAQREPFSVLSSTTAASSHLCGSDHQPHRLGVKKQWQYPGEVSWETCGVSWHSLRKMHLLCTHLCVCTHTCRYLRVAHAGMCVPVRACVAGYARGCVHTSVTAHRHVCACALCVCAAVCALVGVCIKKVGPCGPHASPPPNIWPFRRWGAIS